jgi:hypothetical protein
VKVQDLIERLKGYEDFELEAVFVNNSNPNGKFMDLSTFKVIDIADIGYSDKVIVLDLE